MKEIAEHVLDIVQNSIFAGAKTIQVSVLEDHEQDQLMLEVTDDGCGMSPELVASVLDPFVSTRKKRTGLGLPLLSQTAQQTGGEMVIESQLGIGTSVRALLGYSHIDRPPLGRIVDSIVLSITDEADIVFEHRVRDGGSATTLAALDTKAIRGELEGIPLTHVDVILWVRDFLEEQYSETTIEGVTHHEVIGRAEEDSGEG